jgi:hypothetical protein
MGRAKFGPNSRQVDAFLKALNGLTAGQWERIQEAAPPAGSVPELELAISPGYFKAAQAAALLAKNDVFPGSETAYFDAMRQAHQHVSQTVHSSQRTPLTQGSTTSEIPASGDLEAITELMSQGFASEVEQRTTNAVMLAAGALVMRPWLPPDSFWTLYQPVAAVFPPD